MEAGQPWAIVEAAAAALVSGSLDNETATRLKSASSFLSSNGFTSVALAYLLDIVERHFAAVLIPRFLAEFVQFPEWKRSLSSNALEEKVEAVLTRQCHSFYRHLKFASVLFEDLCSQDNTDRRTLVQQFRLSCLATLIDPPSTFQHALFCYFARQFRLFRDEANKQANESNDEEEAWDSEKFAALCLELRTLDILTIADGVLTEVLFDYVETHLRDKYSENFEEHHLKDIVEWTVRVPLAWLQLVFGTAISTPQYSQMALRVEFFVFEAFCSLRIAKMFDILIEFPQSTPALEDLKECLSRTHQHEELVTELKKAFTQRLLHPGAATAMIIDQYIAVIKALRIIDPSGRTLDEVAAPIRVYLSRREDAIRCIVASFTDDTNSELFEELQGGADGAADLNDADEDKEADPNWTPAILDEHATSEQALGQPRKIDIINMLVSIYGTKELFVGEYRSMLAERLLNILDYNTEREIRIVELLKLRFGEGSMEQCEIMLRDMAESKRNDGTIHQQLVAPQVVVPMANFNATIVSPLFWPAFREEPLALHPSVQQMCDLYKAGYEKLKASRKLNWKPHLGTVELELQRANGEPWTVSITPMQATLAMYFQDSSEWNLNALAERLRAPADVVKRRLRFWVNNGLIEQLPNNIYRVAAESVAAGARPAVSNDEEMQSSMANASEDLWRKTKEFVLAMLVNFEDGLTAEQLHRNLGMLGDEFPFHKSVTELNAFLQRLVRDETSLEFAAGLYKVRT